MRRFIAHDVETQVARALIAGDLEHDSLIVVDAHHGEVSVDFRSAHEEAGRR